MESSAMSFPRKRESRLRDRRALSSLDSRFRGNDNGESVIGFVSKQNALGKANDREQALFGPRF